MTDQQLKSIVPYSSVTDRANYLKELNALGEQYGVTSDARILSAFIAQTAHESGSFHYLKELASGKDYDTGRKAVMLGNTPEPDGDGMKYKGRGYIQITGRANYEGFQRWLGGAPDVVSNPEMVERPHLAMLASIYFWKTRNCSKYALNGDFKTLTKIINGGLNGYDSRLVFYNKAKQILNVQ